MEDIKERIELILKNNLVRTLESETKEKLISQLSIYHEELAYQNEELKQINLRLEEISKSYETIFFNSPVAYLILDEDLIIENFNTEAIVLLGEEKLKKMNFTKFISRDFQDDFYLFSKKLLKYQNSSSIIDIQIKDRKKHIKINANILKIKEKNHLLFALINITSEINYQNEIEILNNKDPLTELNNRRALEKIINKYENNETVLPLGIIFCDLNGLKLANDTFGHKCGDHLLKATGDVLKKACRQTDFIARLGGDEFIVILPKISDEKLKEKLAILKKLSKEVRIHEMDLSISFGYSIKKTKGESLVELIKIAEDNMYKNKLFITASQRQQVIKGIITTLHEKHPREEQHSERVSHYLVEFGKALNFDETKLINLKMAGLLHDIGKIAIDYSILDKVGLLTVEEFGEIKKHTDTGYRILKSAGAFADIIEMVLSHHERVDGKGYPRGLKGEEILQEVKMLTICDTFDAMISERPYKKPLSLEASIEELTRGKGSQFDGELVELFISRVIPKISKL